MTTTGKGLQTLIQLVEDAGASPTFAILKKYAYIQWVMTTGTTFDFKILFPLLSMSYVFQQNYRNSTTN